MIRAAVVALALLSGCAPLPEAPAPIRLDMPAMRSFTAASPGPPLRPNSEIAYDFLDLAFQLESGRTLPILTRFEQPVTVRVAGEVSQVMMNDLTALLGRLRKEARIDIRLTDSATANIVIEALPKRALQRVAPNAACFVVPRVQTWEDMRRNRNGPALDWATLQRRERAAVFVPSDAAPQEMRDCLHEELAQALGPLNDMYRLPDSVFNDDNLHAVLTGFDMLILRAYYAPELSNGMTRDQVARRLPGILARLNPAGERAGGQIPSDTPRAWITAMETALTNRAPAQQRQQAAARAIAIGQTLGWTGAREGFASYAFGRLQLNNDPTLALGAFNSAARAYGQNPVTEIQGAHVALQLAAFALIAGDADTTLAITRQAIPVARRHENAAILSLLMMFQAEALDLQGQTDAAMALRLDSLGWARYGFGTREEVINRLNEIAALTPRQPPS
ncbi:DUF2927 domain-containing protein [Yoonia sp.]|uniref:DUF2927 domain-containing protein n=1 Tax=Yoonia sp. TaxID=2212373 RepID=UPI0019FE96C9|nr:DUF2927 domain-containing protein [Yoonia sp.]MBE0412833.1 DUF2927 domain-containing protein [Yoonia sp.]